MIQIRPYRAAGVPLVLLECPDPADVIRSITAEVATNGTTPPVVTWDCIRGLQGANDPGRALSAGLNNGGAPEMETSNPVEALMRLSRVPAATDQTPGAIIIMAGLGQILNEPQSRIPVSQALWNLRDVYKAMGALLVLTAPLGYKLPAELSNDVVSAVVPLPSPEQHAAILDDMVTSAGINPPDADTAARVVDAVSGLSSFASEQSIALSISREGIDVDSVWERKRRAIEQVPGVSVWRGGETFADIGGCDNVKGFFTRLIAGRRRPRAVVFIDEVEKALGGATGDTSGVSQGMLGAILTHMQDSQAAGCILIGPPGAAKSAISKAVGNEAGCPTIAWDLAGTKDSLVGASEARTRAVLQVIDSVSQGRALWLATCNSIGALPPELRRRFTLGTYFFDLPTSAERAQIWRIWIRKLDLDASQDIPSDDGWTGAEIRQCCDIADRLQISLIEAARYVVPVAVSAADKIAELRRQSSGRYLSANTPGLYVFDPQQAPGLSSGRRMEV